MKTFNRLAILLLAIAMLLLFFSLLKTPDGSSVATWFLTVANFKFLATQTAIIALGALGMMVIVASGGIDLSAGAILALCHGVSLALLHGEHSPLIALSAAFLIGAGVGAINGSLSSWLRLSPVIVTLGMAGVAGGVAQWIGHDDSFFVPSSSWLLRLMAPFPTWIALAPGVWFALILAVGLGFICRKTVFGRHLCAIGSNEEAAEHAGIRVTFVRTLVYMLGGALFGLAGVFQTARLQAAGPSIFGWTLDFLAAVAIGGTRFGGGGGNVVGTLFGALIVAIIRNGSQHAGWHPAAQTIAIGALLVAALAIQQFSQPRLRHASV